MSNASLAIRTSTASFWQGITETLAPPAGAKDGLLPPLMVVLTFVSGIVDAVAYLKLGHVFVANMTGNVVFLGFAAAGAGGLSVPGSLIALACFLIGGASAARLAARLGDSRLHQLRVGTAVQVVLCTAATVAAAVSGANPGTGSQDTLIVLLALAMGVQNATVRRLAVAEFTTTVLTMTLTGLAADSWLGAGAGTKAARRLLAVAAMLLGAVVGAVLLLHVALVAPLAVVTAVLAIVCIAAHLTANREVTLDRQPTPAP